MAAPGVCALRMCWPCHTTAPVRCPCAAAMCNAMRVCWPSRAARALASGPRERVIVSESAAVQESLRRHDTDGTRPWGCLSSWQGPPRPHRYATLVCVWRAKVKRCGLDFDPSRRVPLRCRIAIVHRPLTWLPSEQRKRLRFCGGMQVTSSVASQSAKRSARVAARAVGQRVDLQLNRAPNARRANASGHARRERVSTRAAAASPRHTPPPRPHAARPRRSSSRR